MTFRFAPILVVLATSAATAQVRPQPGIGDPRIQTVEYRPDQVVQITSSPGYHVTIELAPDEQIQTVAVGDSAAWQVTANRSGNLLFVKTTQPGVDTNMTVITNARSYAFDLASPQSVGGLAPYTVRFRYQATQSVDTADTEPKADIGHYDVSGARALQPTRMGDDGERTFIEWSPETALPATFIIDETGREILANGNMRAGRYVIDSVHDHVIFRIDGRKAHARRRLVDDRK